MWTLNPLTGSADRRRAQRRMGIGRRTHGDRRVLPMPTPEALPQGWVPRRGERRRHRRRILADRRSSVSSTPLS